MEKTIVIEVVDANGCTSGHKAGDRFYFDGSGNLLTKLCPSRICFGALGSIGGSDACGIRALLCRRGSRTRCASKGSLYRYGTAVRRLGPHRDGVEVRRSKIENNGTERGCSFVIGGRHMKKLILSALIVLVFAFTIFGPGTGPDQTAPPDLKGGKSLMQSLQERKTSRNSAPGNCRSIYFQIFSGRPAASTDRRAGSEPRLQPSTGRR